MDASSKPRKLVKKAMTYNGSITSSNKRSSNKKRKSKVKRESVLRPSVYQKIQKKRKSSKTNTALSIKADHRRTVFISLRGLYNCWRSVPPHILFDAILIVPLYREWILSPLEYIGYKHDFNDILSDNKFMTLLRWKDKQGLAFFMFSAMDINNELQERIRHRHEQRQHNVSPFWYRLSSKLQSLYDPDTCSSYRALLLNERWWKYAYSNMYCSKYNVCWQEVLNELYFLTMKFSSIQEILYQSNPSLNVIITYSLTPQLMAIRSILSTAPKQTAPKHEEEDIEIDEIQIQIRRSSYLSCDTIQSSSHASSSSQIIQKEIGNYDKASSSSSSPNISSSAMAPVMPFGKEIEDESHSTDNNEMDMEWWVCPNYYYETYKSNKSVIDTDCDTDY